jgi:hypothetical protein
MNAEQVGLPIALPEPSLPEGIDIRNCDVEELLLWCLNNTGGAWNGCDLVFADPPWKYSNTGTNGAVGDRYPTLSVSAIVEHVGLAGSVAGNGAYLAVWVTSPFLKPWFDAVRKMEERDLWPHWRYVSAGAWFKPGTGAGWHWRGDSEHILLYERGGAKPRGGSPPLSNSCYGERTEHSEKPIGWQRAMVRNWTDPGGMVLDLYGGRATVARACVAERRRCIAAEVDEDRWKDSLGLVAGRVGIGSLLEGAP